MDSVEQQFLEFVRHAKADPCEGERTFISLPIPAPKPYYDSRTNKRYLDITEQVMREGEDDITNFLRIRK